MADTRIPLIVFGDGPRYFSGLARIARDLTARLYVHEEELGIRVLQVGVDGGMGWNWQAWPFFGFQQTEKEFGRRAMDEVLEDLRLEGAPTPIVWMITDPGRCYDLTREALPRETHLAYQSLLAAASFWGYFPIDAHNIHHAVGGPAAEAVKACDRVMGYGKYGAEVLKRTLRPTPDAPPGPPVQYLPHGLEPGLWVPRPLEEADSSFQKWASYYPNWTGLKIGCVATNQPRKDLALYFGALSALQKHGVPVLAWLHTDLMTKAWDVGQLAYDFGIPREQIFVTVGQLSDPQLAARYTWCDSTVAPGLGEGFGYPIVESLACGTPCVHGNYAGGVELIPDQDWLFEPVGWRLESCYNLFRPVFKPDDVAATIMRIGQRGALKSAYCQGAVRHLGWDQLWPRWRGWIEKGIQMHREALNGD